MKIKSLTAIIFFIIAAIVFSFITYSLCVFDVISIDNETLPKGIPIVVIMANLSSGNAPLNVQFKSLPQHFDEDLTYLWDFGDKATSNEKNPHHLYSTAGDYMCTLTVQDNTSQSSDELIISVHNNNPPIIKIVVDKASGNRPMTVNFDAVGFDIDGTIESYAWEIIYPPFFSIQKVITHSEKNFSERFIRTGFYEVKLIATDDYGNTATDYIKIQVLGHKFELLLRTSVYYIGILDTIYQILNKFINIITPSASQNVINRIISSRR